MTKHKVGQQYGKNFRADKRKHLTEAYNAGKQAYWDGFLKIENPYSPIKQKYQHKRWANGHDRARFEASHGNPAS